MLTVIIILSISLSVNLNLLKELKNTKDLLYLYGGLSLVGMITLGWMLYGNAYQIVIPAIVFVMVIVHVMLVSMMLIELLIED